MEIRVWDQNVHNCNATHTAAHVKRVLAQAHLVQLMKPLIICTMCAWDNTCFACVLLWGNFIQGFEKFIEFGEASW